MAKVRVHELAKEFGIESKTVLIELKRHGEFVKSASSMLEPRVVAMMRAHYTGEPDVGGAGPRSSDRRDIRDSLPEMVAASPTEKTGNRVPTSSAERTANATTRQGSEPAPKVVPLHSLSAAREVNEVLRTCREELAKGNRRLVLDFADATGFYPSAAVPVAAIVQHFRSQGLAVDMVNMPEIAEVMRIRNPLEASPGNLQETTEPLSRLWVYFDHAQANALTTRYMDCIRRKVECESGVLEALEWCLCEVLDNVTQHSESGAGFTMLQLHPQSKRLVASVADTGIGIRSSLSTSKSFRPRTDFDALTLCIREGVTKNEVTNQGNGLFGLTQIIEKNGGRLMMRTGKGRLTLAGDRVTGKNDQPSIGSGHQATFVDFQLNVDKPIRLGEALKHPPASLFLESLESDEGEHIVGIRDLAGGAGSRLAARELRTLIVNVLNDGAAHVVLDFEGQAVVSSSFADEVIGKLFAAMGFTTFTARIRIRNTNETVRALVDRAIAKRLATSSTGG